jgi:integrase
VAGHPVTPRHCVRRGRPRPTALSREPVQRLLAQSDPPLDRALLLVRLRCGLRVSAVAQLTRVQIAGAQQAGQIVQGKGRKERRGEMSPEARASVQPCREQPPGVQGSVFGHRKRARQPLAVKALHKKLERYAKAAGSTASGHSLRPTLASNRLEPGAAVVAIRAFLGPSHIASSARDAKLSSQKIQQESRRTLQKMLQQGQVGAPGAAPWANY